MGSFDDLPRLFQLTRFKDDKQISGIGKVIVGVVFPDGKTVVQWQKEPKSISIFTSLGDFQRVHAKPIYNENEFKWFEGYEPAFEVDNACEEISNFILSYSGGRISDRTKGELVGKVKAIQQSHTKRRNGGFSPSALANIRRNQRAAPTAHPIKEDKK